MKPPITPFKPALWLSLSCFLVVGIAAASSSLFGEGPRQYAPAAFEEQQFPEVVSKWSIGREVVVSGTYSPALGCYLEVYGDDPVAAWKTGRGAEGSITSSGNSVVFLCSSRLQSPVERKMPYMKATGGVPVIATVSFSLPFAARDTSLVLPVFRTGTAVGISYATARFSGSGLPPSWHPFEARTGNVLVELSAGKVISIAFTTHASSLKEEQAL